MARSNSRFERLCRGILTLGPVLNSLRRAAAYLQLSTIGYPGAREGVASRGGSRPEDLRGVRAGTTWAGRISRWRIGCSLLIHHLNLSACQPDLINGYRRDFPRSTRGAGAMGGVNGCNW